MTKFTSEKNRYAERIRYSEWKLFSNSAVLYRVKLLFVFLFFLVFRGKILDTIFCVINFQTLFHREVKNFVKFWQIRWYASELNYYVMIKIFSEANVLSDSNLGISSSNI